MAATLSHVLGQEQVVRVLRRATAANRVAQAYLFSGPPGVGKATCARALAAALNCAEKPGEGCGRCVSCDKVARDLHPDLMVLSPTGAYIKVEQVRALEEQLSFRPHEGAWRLVLVDGADQLFANAANAMLKSVEEPRPGTVFVLVSSAAHRVIPTLVSRCQRLRFLPLAAPVVETLLEGAQPDAPPQDRRAAAALCEGSARRALDLLEGDRISTLQEIADRVLDAARSGKVVEIFNAVAGAGKERAILDEALDLLRVKLRGGLLCAAGLGPGEGEQPRGRLGMALDDLRAVDRAQIALRGNVNPSLVLENLAFSLKGRPPGEAGL